MKGVNKNILHEEVSDTNYRYVVQVTSHTFDT